MNGEAAKSLYEEFLSEMKKQYAEDKIKDGIFAALMQVIPFLKLVLFEVGLELKSNVQIKNFNLWVYFTNSVLFVV